MFVVVDFAGAGPGLLVVDFAGAGPGLLVVDFAGASGVFGDSPGPTSVTTRVSNSLWNSDVQSKIKKLIQ